jgi:hypothetical protein
MAIDCKLSLAPDQTQVVRRAWHTHSSCAGAGGGAPEELCVRVARASGMGLRQRLQLRHPARPVDDGLGRGHAGL